jgi:methyl-accepting chemotaxis protein
MNIKTKLISNVLLIVIAIAAVVAASVASMGYISGKLNYLTQKSTPYQTKTLEFQRELQAAASALVKVGTAHNDTELTSLRKEADGALEQVKSVQKKLEEMQGSHLSTSEELTRISQDLYSATTARLAAGRDSQERGRSVTQRLKESSARLKTLDQRMRSLQTGRSGTFSTALTNTNRYAERMRSIEELRSLFKDLQLIVLEGRTSRGPGYVTGAKVRSNAILRRIRNNEFVKNSPETTTEIKWVSDRVADFLKAQADSKEEAKALSATIEKELSDRLTNTVQNLDVESSQSSQKMVTESENQDKAYSQSNVATNILQANSEMVSSGIMLEGQATRLFTMTTPEELDLSARETQGVFARIDEQAKGLERSLAKLGAKEEAKVLATAVAAIRGIRGEIFSEQGIVETLKKRMATEATAQKLGDRLREVVATEAAKGKETVTIAQGEQDKAVTSVNKIVRQSIAGLIILSAIAAIAGILFGIWIFRSVSNPLTGLIGMSKDVAGGDLRSHDSKHSDDEFGSVQDSVHSMVDNLRDMAGKISTATATVASSAEELSATAGELDKNAAIQSGQIDQSVTAMTEMTQAIQDVARNANETADYAGRMKQIALGGKRSLDETSGELDTFAEVVRQSAEKIESLGESSAAITDIVDMIKDIADQTNLLALNASIEAARAGDMGRGFAVVADSVRQLAYRTTESADEIGRTVKEMKGKVDGSVSIMQKERTAIESIMTRVEATQKSMEEIVACVEQVYGMVQTIATTTEEQSATAEDVNRSMVSISEITRQLSASVNDIIGTSHSFASLATDLQQMVSWFKL